MGVFSNRVTLRICRVNHRDLVQFQDFFDNRYKDVNGDGNPDLSFHGIVGCPIKRLDPEMLLDPFEKQLHLPAAAIQVSDGYCRKDKVVGQKHECFVVLGIEVANTP